MHFFGLLEKPFEFYPCNLDYFCHLKTTFCKTRFWSKLFVVRTHTSQIQSLPTRGWIHQTCPTRGIRLSARCGCGGSWGLDHGLRVPSMALLACRPFGPSSSHYAFNFRIVHHPSVHCSLATAVGNQLGSRRSCSGWSGGG